jgi:hypothetical protein
MKKYLFCMILLFAAISAHAGMIFKEYYDNPRFQNDFQRSDNLFAHGTGVTTVRLPGDPQPRFSSMEGTIFVVDSGYERFLWNFSSPDQGIVSIKD